MSSKDKTDIGDLRVRDPRVNLPRYITTSVCSGHIGADGFVTLDYRPDCNLFGFEGIAAYDGRSVKQIRRIITKVRFASRYADARSLGHLYIEEPGHWATYERPWTVPMTHTSSWDVFCAKYEAFKTKNKSAWCAEGGAAPHR